MPAERRTRKAGAAVEAERTDAAAADTADTEQQRPTRRRRTAAKTEAPGPVAQPDASAAAEPVDAPREETPPGESGRIRVKLIRSTIGHRAGARGTVRALGLHRLNETVEVNDTVENRGMLRRIAFLVEVTEAAGTSADGGGDR